jgi:hypothetical protein
MRRCDGSRILLLAAQPGLHPSKLSESHSGGRAPHPARVLRRRQLGVPVTRSRAGRRCPTHPLQMHARSRGPRKSQPYGQHFQLLAHSERLASAESFRVRPSSIRDRFSLGFESRPLRKLSSRRKSRSGAGHTLATAGVQACGDAGEQSRARRRQPKGDAGKRSRIEGPDETAIEPRSPPARPAKLRIGHRLLAEKRSKSTTRALEARGRGSLAPPRGRRGRYGAREAMRRASLAGHWANEAAPRPSFAGRVTSKWASA